MKHTLICCSAMPLCGRASAAERALAESTRVDDEIWAEVRLDGKKIGFYHETTGQIGDEVLTKIDLQFALGRLGSEVLVRSHVVYTQTPDGGLRRVHAESSSLSKTLTITEVTVQGASLQIRTSSNGKVYDH